MNRLHINIGLIGIAAIVFLSVFSCVCIASNETTMRAINISEAPVRAEILSSNNSEIARINSAEMDGAFLYISGLQGESTDVNHRNWIDVASFNLGLSSTGTTHIGSGAGAGKVSINDLVVSKRLDRTSPKLYETICSGSHYDQAKLELVRSGKVIMEYQLSEVLITSAETGSSLADGSQMPMETISLNFARITWTYYQYNADGSLMGVVKSAWDIAKNVAVIKA